MQSQLYPFSSDLWRGPYFLLFFPFLPFFGMGTTHRTMILEPAQPGPAPAA